MKKSIVLVAILGFSSLAMADVYQKCVVCHGKTGERAALGYPGCGRDPGGPYLSAAHNGLTQRSRIYDRAFGATRDNGVVWIRTD